MIPWPENQVVMEWLDDYYNLCFPYERCMMVPVDLWDDFQNNPGKYYGWEDIKND
jgi:hypothetical protein